MKKQLEEGWQRVEFYVWCESGRGELREQAAAAVEIYWIISSERRRTDTTNRSGDGPWSISHAATNTMLCHYHRLYFGADSIVQIGVDKGTKMRGQKYSSK